MDHRTRVLKAVDFEKTDRPACDLMEGFVWPEMADYFKDVYGFDTKEQILDFLDVDFRWVYAEKKEITSLDKESFEKKHLTYSGSTFKRPLAEVETVNQLRSAYDWRFDPDSIIVPDYKRARDKWPNHAISVIAEIPSLFMTSCTDFGMEESLIKMMTMPEVFDEYMSLLYKKSEDMIPYVLNNAKGNTDFCWLIDDIASQEDLIMDPSYWRKFFKPYLAKQIALVKEFGQRVIFHSCGAIRSVIPDLIEIGVDVMLVFQTSAKNMEAKSIADEFGGKIAFYGGIDVQSLLRKGTPEEVRQTVKYNVDSFKDKRGYIVSNSHHGISDIKCENIITMCDEAHRL